MNLHPPPHGNDPIITQFKPVKGQWELNDENIKYIDPETGRTILHNYCQYINTTPVEVYQYLIETKGCDINAQDDDKDTPLHSVLSRCDPNDGGEITVLTYLLSQKGVDGNIKGWNDYTLLHQACISINGLPLEIFKLLIETHGCDVNAQNNLKSTPLHHALRYFNPNNGGDITVLMYLINQKDVNGNIEGWSDYTLLHWACYNINNLPLYVFKLLIETMGFDVNAQDKRKDTSLHHAFRYFDPNKGGDINVVTYLFSQKGVNANIKDKYGYTLLHWACQRINILPLDIFKVLIETHGADVNAQDEDKTTPIYSALDQFNPRNGGDINVLAYLLNQNNVGINIKNEKGRNLLHYACTNNLSIYQRSVELDAEYDTVLYQIVEDIIERLVQQVLDETNLE